MIGCQLERGWSLRMVVGPRFDVRMSEWVVVGAGGGGYV